MTEFKRGEVVEVKYHWAKEWELRIYVGKIEGARNPYICVSFGDESLFKQGKPFDVTAWGNCQKIQPNLKMDDPVLVWNSSQSDPPKRRHFKEWAEDGKIICWDKGCTSWSVQYPNDCTVWDYYEIPNNQGKGKK